MIKRKVCDLPVIHEVIYKHFTKLDLNVFHCNFMFDDTSEEEAILIGVNGTRFNSPWKVISSRHLTSPLRKPTRKKSALSIPSLQSLISCSSSEEFINLLGEEDGNDLKFIEKIPNVHWIAPQLFIACVDGASIRAADLAIMIINKVAWTWPIMALNSLDHIARNSRIFVHGF